MAIRFLIAVLLCWPTIAAGQVTGRFFLQKETFAPGEPVFLYFEATNSGTETQNILQADPYSFCSGYAVRVTSDPASNSSCASLGMGGSCLSSDAPLAPGKSRIERILLNYQHKIDAVGSYDVEAVRELPYAPATEDYFESTKNSVEVRQLLHFTVDDSVAVNSALTASLVDQLKSDDPAARRDAARALASVAPKSLEDLLLSFADNSDFRSFAPLAFHNLNTQRSIEGLAAIVGKSEAGTYESMESADYLAEGGDPKWYPLLLKIAEKHSGVGNYVDDAAQTGGSQILPVLLQMMNTKDDEYSRFNAVSALGYTGSPAAVPILLSLLRSPDPDLGGYAVSALRKLTHRSAVDELWSENSQSQYSKWVEWWNRNGIDARIYKATECGEIKLLP